MPKQNSLAELSDVEQLAPEPSGPLLALFAVVKMGFSHVVGEREK